MTELKKIMLWQKARDRWEGPGDLLKENGVEPFITDDPMRLMYAVKNREVQALIIIEEKMSTLAIDLVSLVLYTDPWFPILYLYDEMQPEALHQLVRRGVFATVCRQEPETEFSQALRSLAAYLDNLHSFPGKYRSLFGPQGFGPLIGNSFAMQEVYSFMVRLMEHDITVAVYGQSGTGKEIVARMLHHYSGRKGKKFVTINCAAVPEALLESELFGHEKGAFTGAVNDRIGKFEFAHEGSLFLDEIGEMSLPLQAKLLRIIEQGQFEKVGSNTTKKVDVRLITATNRDLENEVDKGNFRSDLLFRINVFPLRLPSLSDRYHDAMLLSHRIIDKLSNGRIKGISKEMLKNIKTNPWQGNVRQLENMLTRLVVLEDSQVLDKSFIDLSPQQMNSLPGNSGTQAEKAPFNLEKLSDLEAWQIDRIMSSTSGNISEAARRLGISRVALYRKLGKQEDNNGE